MINARHLPRLLALLATALLAVSACAGGSGGINLAAYTEPAISPLLTGMADSVLPSYYSWFNSPNNPDTPNPLEVNPTTGEIAGITDVKANTISSKIVLLDPNCGLEYAWDKMRNRQDVKPYDDKLPIGTAGSSAPGYNPATQEVLFLIRGYAIAGQSASDYDSSGNIKACSKRTAGYIPLILDLVSGRWNVEGLASPGATIDIRMSVSNDMSPVDGSGQLQSQDSIVAPDRLSRFAVTDANFARVMKFATVSKTMNLARGVSWFRTSDLNPDYTYQSVLNRPTSMCEPFLAFWGAAGASSISQSSWSDLKDAASQSCSAALAQIVSDNGTYYADPTQKNQGDGIYSFDYEQPTWRQADPNGNMPETNKTSGDNNSNTVAHYDGDDSGRFTVGATCPIPVVSDIFGCVTTSVGNATSQFQDISNQLMFLALTATNTDDGHPLQVKCDMPADKNSPPKATVTYTGSQPRWWTKVRAQAFCAIQFDLQSTYNGTAYISSTPNGDVASWQSLPSDVFGVAADNGPHALSDTVDTINTSTYARGLAGFAGQPNLSGNPLHTIDTTITPTLSVASIKTDAAQAAFYQSHSFLFNSQDSTFDVMSFSTSDPNKTVHDPSDPNVNGDLSGIPYVQGPLVQLEIDVTNALDVTNTASYVSSYIPLYALNRNGPDVGVSVSYNPLTQFPQAVTQAVNGLVYNIYSSTVGSWTSSLTHGATSNLFALPMLTQYQVLYYNSGNPVYAPSDLVLKPAAFAALQTKSSNGNPATLKTLSRREQDEYTCTTAARTQNFNKLLDDPKTAGTYGMCVAQDPFFGLWDFFRSLSILLMVLLIARYFFGLISFETGQIRPIGFLARVFIAMGLTLGMNVILGLLARGVAETILITNIVGTNLSNGQSYNYLWLFADYLRAPAHDLSLINAFFLFPFTLIGLLFIIISSWLRVGVALFVVCLSPIWVFSLLTDRQMRVFTSGLSMLFRLYLVPMAALFILLALFLVSRVVGLDPTQKNGLYAIDMIGAIVRMMFMVAVAIVPWFLAKYLAIAPVAALKTAIAKTTEMADHTGANAWLEAGAGGVAALNASNAARAKEEREKIEAGEKGGDEAKALGPGEGDEDRADDEGEDGGEGGEGGPGMLERTAGAAGDLALEADTDKKPDLPEGEGGAENLALANPLDDEAEDGSQDMLAEGEEAVEADALASGGGFSGEALASSDDSSESPDGGEDGTSDGTQDVEGSPASATDEDSVAALGEGEDDGPADEEEGDFSPLTPDQQAQLDFFDNARRMANGLPPLADGAVVDPVAQAKADIVTQEANDYVDDVARIGRGEPPKHVPAPLSPKEETAQRKAFFEDRRRMAAGGLPQMSPDEFRDAHVRILNQNRLSAAESSNAATATAGQTPAKGAAKGAASDERWSGGRSPSKAASMLALVPGHDSEGRKLVSAANRGNRPRFMDRFGTKTQRAIRAAALVTDLDSIKADWVGTSERPGSLRHQGRIVRNAGLLSTITGTAFVERVSTAELKGAHETIKAHKDPARQQQWLARDPEALRQFQETEGQIRTLKAAAARNPEDYEVQMRLAEAESTRGALLAAAKPDKAFAAQYAQAQHVVTDAKELGGAGTNFGRGMANRTKAFQDSVTAYQAGSRGGLSDEMMDPRRWAVRLAANSQTNAWKVKNSAVATDARWSRRQAEERAARSKLDEDMASLAMARADAESAAASRGALVNNIAGHMETNQSASYAALSALTDDPKRFAEQLEKERAAAAARLAAAQKPYQEIDSALTHLLVGGRPPEQALSQHQDQATRIRAEAAAADHEVTSLMAALNSGKALPETTQANYAAQLALAQERHRAAAEQASQHEELVGRIATRIPAYKDLERQRAAGLKERQNAGAADKAFLATLDGLAAKAADPAARPALKEAIRASQHTQASAAGSSAQAYGTRLESVIKNLAVANATNDIAARAEAGKERNALLTSARAELGNAGATRLDETIREGVTRETELIRRQAATSSSYENTATLRNAPPIFSLLHPRKTVSAALARHVGSPNESAVYARHRAGAVARLTSLQAETAILEETAARNARDKREDPHLTEALAAQHAAMAHEQALIEGVNTHDHLMALAADQRRAERLKYREKLHQDTLEQHGTLKRQLERRNSAEVIWNQAQEAAIHGKVDSDTVERRRASYEQESRLAAVEAEKLRRMEAEQQDFLSQND